MCFARLEISLNIKCVMPFESICYAQKTNSNDKYKRSANSIESIVLGCLNISATYLLK